MTTIGRMTFKRLSYSREYSRRKVSNEGLSISKPNTSAMGPFVSFNSENVKACPFKSPSTTISFPEDNSSEWQPKSLTLHKKKRKEKKRTRTRTRTEKRKGLEKATAGTLHKSRGLPIEQAGYSAVEKKLIKLCRGRDLHGQCDLRGLQR